jgi:phosphoribosylamine---glycine ligase
VDVDDRTAVTVVVASEGYPGNYEKGRPIVGLDLVRDAYVFQAGTKLTKEGELVTDGGRVLAITAFGKDLEQAILSAYRNVPLISFEGKYVRSDIGKDLVRMSPSRSGATQRSTN